MHGTKRPADTEHDAKKPHTSSYECHIIDHVPYVSDDLTLSTINAPSKPFEKNDQQKRLDGIIADTKKTIDEKVELLKRAKVPSDTSNLPSISSTEISNEDHQRQQRQQMIEIIESTEDKFALSKQSGIICIPPSLFALNTITTNEQGRVLVALYNERIFRQIHESGITPI